MATWRGLCVQIHWYGTFTLNGCTAFIILILIIVSLAPDLLAAESWADDWAQADASMAAVNFVSA